MNTNPGPWTVEQASDALGHKVLQIVANCGTVVAEVPNLSGFHSANARLLAAAPEMLQTLQWILEYCDELSGENADFGTIGDKASDVIAAAGEQP